VNKYRLLFTNLLREENYTEEVEEMMCTPKTGRI